MFWPPRVVDSTGPPEGRKSEISGTGTTKGRFVISYVLRFNQALARPVSAIAYPTQQDRGFRTDKANLVSPLGTR
jgi:hypothetical protein